MDAELILYYVNLLILQYRKLPNAQAHISALINQLMIYDLMIQVRDGYNIDDAVGVQQDIIGKYLGISRVVTGATFTRDYFGMVEYGDTAPFDHEPFIEYGDPVPDVQYLRYNESLSSLNDEEYRFILKLRLNKNHTNASVRDIDLMMEEFFSGTGTFTDNEDMTIEYEFDSGIERLIIVAQAEGLLPKPAGVGITVTFV